MAMNNPYGPTPYNGADYGVEGTGPVSGFGPQAPHVMTRDEAMAVIARAALAQAQQEITPQAVEQAKSRLSSQSTEQLVRQAIALIGATPPEQRPVIASGHLLDNYNAMVRERALDSSLNGITGQGTRELALEITDFLNQEIEIPESPTLALAKVQERTQQAYELYSQLDPYDPEQEAMGKAVLGYMEKLNAAETGYAEFQHRVGTDVARQRLDLARFTLQRDEAAQRTLEHAAGLQATWYRIRLDEQQHLENRMDAAMKLAWEMETTSKRISLDERRTAADEQRLGFEAINAGANLARLYQSEDHFQTGRIDKLQENILGARKGYSDLLARISNDMGQLTNTGTGYAIDMAKHAPPSTQYVPGYEPGGPYAQLMRRVGGTYDPNMWLTQNFVSGQNIDPYLGAKVAAPGFDEALMGYPRGSDYIDAFAANRATPTPFDPIIGGVVSSGLSPYGGLAGMGPMQSLVDAQEAAGDFYEDDQGDEDE